MSTKQHFLNHKNTFRPIWSVTFCESVFIFRCSHMITNLKFRIFIIISWSLLNYVPFVLSCFTYLSLHVLSYLTCFMPCVLSCVTCLVLYLLSFFTCLVLLVPSSLRTSISHMLYCVLYPSYLMHCFLHISITPFLLLSSYASNDFFMFISNSLAFCAKFKTVYMKIIRI